MDCFFGGALLASLLVDCFLAFELPSRFKIPFFGVRPFGLLTLCASQNLFPRGCCFPISVPSRHVNKYDYNPILAALWIDLGLNNLGTSNVQTPHNL